MKGRPTVEESGPEDLKSGLAAVSGAAPVGLAAGLRQFYVGAADIDVKRQRQELSNYGISVTNHCEY